MPFTANDLAKYSQYIKNALDKKLRLASLTSRFDVANANVKPSGVAGTYLYPQVSIDKGLEDYSKTNGFNTNGAVNQVWKTYTCEYDRGKRLIIDPVEDAQAASVAIANAANEFMTQYVVPEIDAIRFAKYAANAGTIVGKTLTAENIENAYLDAIQCLEDNEFPTDGLTIFCTPRVHNLLKKKYSGSRYLTATEAGVGTKINTIDGIEIVSVPSNRFHKTCTLLTDGGIINAGGEIELLIVSNRSVLQITDHQASRLFSPEVFQDANAWAWDYRVFHGCAVLDNKKAGIYCIMKEDVCQEYTLKIDTALVSGDDLTIKNVATADVTYSYAGTATTKNAQATAIAAAINGATGALFDATASDDTVTLVAKVSTTDKAVTTAKGDGDTVVVTVTETVEPVVGA